MKKTIFFTFTICSLLFGVCNAQWVQVSSGMGNIYIHSMAYSGNNIYAGTGNLDGVYLSTNNGTSWFLTPLYNHVVWSLAANPNYVFAGTDYTGVWLSTNNGTNWFQTSLYNQQVYSLAVNGNNVFAGTSPNGVYLSTNNGSSWTQTSLNNRAIMSLLVNGSLIFAGTSYGIYISDNGGTSWTQTTINNQWVYALAANGNNVFAGTGSPSDGVYKSTNNGVSWTQTSLNNRSIWSLAVSGNNIFAGTANSYGVYVSTNNGTNWTQRNEGLTTSQVIRALFILNNYIYAGTQSNGVWRRPLSELVGIQPISTEIPEQFSLSQNYPNPFNPTTKIRFQVARTPLTPLSQRGDNVRLVVFDVLGREVATLVNEQLTAGTYEADWNAAQFSSGVYYYKIITDDLIQTRKMVLVK